MKVQRLFGLAFIWWRQRRGIPPDKHMCTGCCRNNLSYFDNLFQALHYSNNGDEHKKEV